MKKEETTKSAIHSLTLGYEPKDMKPVHLFTTFFLTVTGRAQRNEVLNKTAVVRHKKGLQGGYISEELHQRLAAEKRIADSLTKKELDSIRHSLHALLNNDQAMNAAFRPFSTFGNDYTGTSEWFLSHHTRLDGYAGTFLYQIFDATREGKEVLKFAREAILEQDDTLTAFARPVLGDETSEEIVDLAVAYRDKFGDLTSERLQQISQLMRAETKALIVLCDNLKQRESKYSRLRHLILGLGAWLFRYLLKVATPSPQRPTLFMDFSDHADSRLRAQSRWCYNRHYNNVLELYERWNTDGRYDVDIEEAGVFAKKNGKRASGASDYAFLAEHYLELAVRMGFAQPRSGSTYKHFELQPDTMRTMLLSVISPDAVEEISTVAPRLRETWGVVFGGCPDDRGFLRDDGYSGIDEEDLFGVDRAGFIRLAEKLNMASEPSDGLVLFAATPEMLP
jgi:hypothetical protein